MKPYLDIEEMILLNQAAQELRPLADLVAWFEAQPQERRALVLSEVADMIQHAKPRPEDGALAVKESGLRSTFTACVIISKGADMVRVRKVANLPEAERTKALIILLNLFRISDRRRQRQEVGEPERHWWHQNLGDATVLEEIRRRYREGQL